MIVSNSLLYSRVLTPYGKMVKEPTFLGAVLIALGLMAAGYAFYVLCSFL